MAKSFLIIFLSAYSVLSYAQFLGFGEDKSIFKSKLPSIIEKINQLEINVGPQFEELFNQNVSLLEITLDQEILYCSGEAMNEKGGFITNDKKQTCIRELRQRYIEGINLIFDIKKKYLTLISEQHRESLSRAQAQAIKAMESKF